MTLRIEVFEVDRSELEPGTPLMNEMNAWGKAYFDQVEAHCQEGATDRVRFLVGEWIAGKPVSTQDGPFPGPEYADYTAEEKRDAHGRIHQIISMGCG